MAKQQLQKVNWWHESIIDWMLENPHAQLCECAVYFEKTPGWISVVINSAAFQDLLASRKLLHAHMVSMTLTEKLEGIAHRSLESLEKAMKDTEDKALMSVGCARDTAEMSLKMLGYSARSPGAINILAQKGAQVTVGQATPEALARARENMKNVTHPEITEGNLAIEGELDTSALPTPT